MEIDMSEERTQRRTIVITGTDNKADDKDYYGGLQLLRNIRLTVPYGAPPSTEREGTLLSVPIKNKETELLIWATAGKKLNKEADTMLYCINANDPDGLKNFQNWLDNEYKLCRSNTPIAVVMTKCDDTNKEQQQHIDAIADFAKEKNYPFFISGKGWYSNNKDLSDRSNYKSLHDSAAENESFIKAVADKTVALTLTTDKKKTVQPRRTGVCSL
jgi:hypothetical protein